MARPAVPAMTMADWAAGITDIGDSTPSFNLLIHGAPGSGKTRLLSALPNALLLGFDPGYATAKALGRKCQVRPVNNERELMAGVEWLEDGGYQNYQWVIPDGLNILQAKMTLANAAEAWTADNTKRVNRYQPDKPDYFKQQNALKTAVARLCDLPVNVAFTAHSTEGGDEDDLGTWIRPQIEGREYKVGNFICGLQSCIGYLAVREREVKVRGRTTTEPVRRLLWEQRYDKDTGVTIMARDQIGAFPTVMDEPTGEQVHDLLVAVGQ